MSTVEFQGSSRVFSTYMHRSMRPQDLLLGVMGLDRPPSGVTSRRHCCDHRIRQVRMALSRHVPFIVTLNRKAQHLYDALSREGIALGILRRGVRRHSPTRATLHSAMHPGIGREHQRRAWRDCGQSWGVKASMLMMNHIDSYGPLCIVHVLTTYDVVHTLLGHPEDLQEARRRLRVAIKVLHPSRDALTLKYKLTAEEAKGRARMCDLVLRVNRLLEHPVYQEMLFHPEMKTWGRFSTTGAIFAAVAVVGAGTYLWSAGVIGLAIAATLIGAAITNEIRLWFRDAWKEDNKPSGGVKAWASNSWYRGRVWECQGG